MPGMSDPLPTSPVNIVRTRDALVYIQASQPMQRLLSFAGRTMDEVVNCPVARRHVTIYYRVGRQIERTCEAIELERQWNPLGRG